jgi:hypothetical protein
MAMKRIVIEVSDSEFDEIIKVRRDKTWRELLLPPLGIKTQRRSSGPKRRQGSEVA